MVCRSAMTLRCFYAKSLTCRSLTGAFLYIERDLFNVMMGSFLMRKALMLYRAGNGSFTKSFGPVMRGELRLYPVMTICRIIFISVFIECLFLAAVPVWHISPFGWFLKIMLLAVSFSGLSCAASCEESAKNSFTVRLAKKML